VVQLRMPCRAVRMEFLLWQRNGQGVSSRILAPLQDPPGKPFGRIWIGASDRNAHPTRSARAAPQAFLCLRRGSIPGNPLPGFLRSWRQSGAYRVQFSWQDDPYFTPRMLSLTIMIYFRTGD